MFLNDFLNNVKDLYDNTNAENQENTTRSLEQCYETQNQVGIERKIFVFYSVSCSFSRFG